MTEIEQLQAQVVELTRRMEQYEHPQLPVPSAKLPAGITEPELIAISAAVAAFLGLRAHIRQIRLVSSNAWAQQGRVFIQASHRL